MCDEDLTVFPVPISAQRQPCSSLDACALANRLTVLYLIEFKQIAGKINVAKTDALGVPRDDTLNMLKLGKTVWLAEITVKRKRRKRITTARK